MIGTKRNPKGVAVGAALLTATVIVLTTIVVSRPGSTASADPKDKIFGFYLRGAVPEQTEIPDGATVAMEAQCDPGDMVMGGGYGTPSHNRDFTVTANQIFSPSIWRVIVSNESGGPLTFRVTARCIDVTP